MDPIEQLIDQVLRLNVTGTIGDGKVAQLRVAAVRAKVYHHRIEKALKRLTKPVDGLGAPWAGAHD